MEGHKNEISKFREIIRKISLQERGMEEECFRTKARLCRWKSAWILAHLPKYSAHIMLFYMEKPTTGGAD